MLGRDRSLVLHGGGNTSIKVRERDIVGLEDEILYVKGSGWDLETIEAPGFSPLRRRRLLDLLELDALVDTQMARELQASMTDPTAPVPSVESLLHALTVSRADGSVRLADTGSLRRPRPHVNRSA